MNVKNFKTFKKLSVAVLSVVSIITFSFACLPLSTQVKGAYDYTQESTAKSDEYLHDLFKTNKQEGITIQSNYTVPSYINPNNTNLTNGVLLTFNQNGLSGTTDGFDNNNAYVELDKTYKFSELSKNLITIMPIVEKENVGKKAEIQKFTISVIDKVNDKSINIQVLTNQHGYDGIGLAQALVATKEGTVTQTFGGVSKTEKPELKNTVFYNQTMLWGKTSGGILNKSFAGSNLLHTNDKGEPISFNEYNEPATLYSNFKFYIDKNEAGEVVVRSNRSRNGENGEIRNVSSNKMNSDIVTADTTEEDIEKANIVPCNDPVFSGFDENAELTIRIQVDEFVSGVTSARLLISEVAGEDITSPIRIKNNYGGVVGKVNVLPKAYAYYKNGLESTDFTGFYEFVEIPEGSNVSKTKTAYTENASFTPDKVGNYKIKFTAEKDGKYYSSNYIYKVKEDASVNIKLTNQNLTDIERLWGETISIGGIATSTIYEDRDLTSLKATVKYYENGYSQNGVQETVLTNVNETTTYTFKNCGDYEIVYDAYDSINTTAQQTVKFTIINAVYSLNVQNGFDWLYGNEITKPEIDKDIIKVVTNYGDYGSEILSNPSSGAIVDLKVKKPNDTSFTKINENEPYEFPKGLFGEYTFSYLLTFTANNKTLTVPENGVPYEFTINVIDDNSPTFEKLNGDYLINAIKQSEEGKVITYNAKNGTKITFSRFNAFDQVGTQEGGSLKVDYTQDIVLNLTMPTGVTEDFSTAFKEGNNLSGFNYTLNGVGEYRFNFSVQDADGNSDTITIIVNCLDELYSFMNIQIPNESYTTNNVLEFNGFNVLNGNLEQANVKKYIEFYRNGIKLDKTIENGNGSIQFELSGSYEMVYVAELNSKQVATKTFKFIVTDKTPPIIIISGSVINGGVVGKEIELAKYTSRDVETLNSLNKIEVWFGDSKYNVYDNKFTPIEAGTYKVILTATDDNLNVATYTYFIDVVESINPISAIGIIGFILGGLLIAGSVVIIILTLKKRNTINIEE